jgi:hypothetical protein
MNAGLLRFTLGADRGLAQIPQGGMREPFADIGKRDAPRRGFELAADD